LSNPNDQSQSASTLPPAHLNPLLNPLLAENMGRWAEVYFTNPPDKRDQAVLELLRELEANHAGDIQPATTAAILDSAPGHAASEPTHLSSQSSPMPAMESQDEEAVVHCASCGHNNPANHKFCGLCGTKLAEDEVWTPANDETVAPAAFAENQAIAEPEPPQSEFEPYHYVPNNDNGLSLFQNAGRTNYEDRSDDQRSYDYQSDWEDEPASSPPYRIYFGIALALVILGLGYFAWHGAQTSPASDSPLPPPPAATKQNEPAAAAPKADDEQPRPQTPDQQSQQAASNQTASTKKAHETTDDPAETQPAKAESQPARNEKAAGAALQSSNAGAGTQTAPANASSGNGGEELAIAERYLNGTNGQGRDSVEAAKWLWKSIAKHNGEATVLLADLYMKGDGVSKNCDQARVLLDSAASKGVSGAGERLRNLQAFGCQ